MDVDETAEGQEETPLVNLVAGGVTFVTLAVAFGLLALGVESFWVAFPVGFGGGMPLAVGLAKYYESRRDAAGGDRGRGRRAGESDTDEALAQLRDRYARGELTDEEFETRVERLLETESVPDAKAYAERERTDETGHEKTGNAESVPEREEA